LKRTRPDVVRDDGEQAKLLCHSRFRERRGTLHTFVGFCPSRRTKNNAKLKALSGVSGPGEGERPDSPATEGNEQSNAMKKNFRIASIVMLVVGVLFFAGATALFVFSKAPENGWLQLGWGVPFLLAAIAFWWLGRNTPLGT
jgi:hypothetical protein